MLTTPARVLCTAGRVRSGFGFPKALRRQYKILGLPPTRKQYLPNFTPLFCRSTFPVDFFCPRFSFYFSGRLPASIAAGAGAGAGSCRASGPSCRRGGRLRRPPFHPWRGRRRLLGAGVQKFWCYCNYTSLRACINALTCLYVEGAFFAISNPQIHTLSPETRSPEQHAPSGDFPYL